VVRAVVLGSLLVGCGARSELPTPDRDGHEGGGGAATQCELAEQRFRLRGTIRDFRDDHPDFEQGVLGDDRGIVETALGRDGLPIYASDGETLTTNGRDSFDTWYRDVPGTNRSQAFAIDLVTGAGVAAYADTAFFPIDGELLGDQGRDHNYHFTLHATFAFERRGGEVFSFAGDDDLWVFVDGALVVDLGGVHSTQNAELQVDAVADRLGLVDGERYDLAIFFAERQTSGSTFTLGLANFAFCE